LQNNNSPIVESTLSEENPQSNPTDSPDFKQLVRQLAEITSSPDFEKPTFQDEIAALRTSLKHLQESFTQVDSLEEQLKLTAAISHLTASLARLVRAQEYLRPHIPSAFNQAVDRALDVVLKEWGWD
jgi:hypothetical protein